MAVRITAVENFDGWVVVARLPIPEKGLDPSDALLEAGTALAMLWEGGRNRPGEPLTVCEDSKKLAWPKDAKPAGVLVQGEKAPISRVMDDGDAEDLFDYIAGRAEAIKQAMDADDPDLAHRFDKGHSDGPPWPSESENDPLDLGEAEAKIRREFDSERVR